MRGYNNKITNATEYIILDLYFPESLYSVLVLAKLTIKIYLTKNLKANMLIGTDVLITYKFYLDYNT